MINKVKTFDPITLARIHGYFNMWEFPDELMEFKPDLWDLWPLDNKQEYIWDVQRYIESVIDDRVIMREWHKIIGSYKNEDDFNTWYDVERNRPLTEEELGVLRYISKISNPIVN